MNLGLDSTNTSLKKKLQQNEYNIISAHHKFLWDEDNNVETSIENRIAKDYHDKLFKEYCIGDLTYYKTKKIALRWRTKQEVLSGKGESICGDRYCNVKDELKSWEVNFKYIEHGKQINALVKLRLCKKCSIKLNFYTSNEKSLKKENSQSAQEQSQLCTKTLVDENKKEQDKNNFIWTTKNPESTNTNIHKRMEDYLLDMFQFT